MPRAARANPIGLPQPVGKILHIQPADTSVSIEPLIASWHRSLLAENKSPQTIRTYLASTKALASFLEARGINTVVLIRREHVEDFINSLLATAKPATALNRFSGIKPFFNWLTTEGEIDAHPMANMKKPRLPEYSPPVLTDAQLESLVSACKGPTAADRRDMALVRMLIGTGARLNEIVSLKVEDVDLQTAQIKVMGKNRRERHIWIGNKANLALDRYLRTRGVVGPTDPLWIGKYGPMTDSGVAQVLRKRGARSGIVGLHAHQLRHAVAHRRLADGQQEGAVMSLMGWRDPSMLRRYARAEQNNRALEDDRRRGIADRI